MSTDISRNSFRPERDYAQVVTQQGRVRLDADDNEQAAIVDRRLRAMAIDLGGRAIVPASTPDAFRITLGAGKPVIGPGRLYVDGLLAENRGKGTIAFDPSLDEWRAAGPLPYEAQPWLPAPGAPPQGRYLAYLDVWRRPVTFVQQPDLVEKAVGVDTAARLQTVWQVRLAPIAAATCALAADDPAWAAITQPSAARLTTATSAALPATDPCQAPVAGGYRGLENQLYRVEIHDGGTQAQATFKWSRDNASVETAVRGIDPGRTRLTVDSLGRDDRLGFGDGDWVEVTDDARELAGLPGALLRIATGGGIEAATRTITLASALPAGWFPTGASGATSAARHTRVKRWDQAGRVLKGDGGLHVDLDAAGSKGVIGLPVTGAPVALEDGITVAFNLAAANAKYRSGEYWIFAARAADASIELLDGVAPAGPHHHFARLAIVSAGGVEDCRTPWPPVAKDGCTCLAVPAGFDLAALPALLPADRQVHLCLAAGEFRIGAAVVLDGKAQKGRGALRLTGAGPATRIVASGEAGLVLNGWEHAVVSDLSVATGTTERVVQRGVGILGGVTALDCGAVTFTSIVASAAGGHPAACLRVAAVDAATESVRIAGCTLSAGPAVSAILVTGTKRTAIVDNVIGGVTAAAGANARSDRLDDVRKRQAIRGGGGLIGSPEAIVGDGKPKQAKAPAGQARAIVRSGKTAAAFNTPEMLEDAWADWYAAEPPAKPFASAVLLIADLRKRASRMIKQKGDVPRVPAFAAWYNNTRKDPVSPAAGIVVAGALAESVRIERNDVAGARHGIRAALSHHAPRTARDVIGRVVIADNVVRTAATSPDAVRAIGVMAGSSAGTTVAGNRVSGGVNAKQKGLEGVRLFGDLGRFAIVRENQLDGFATGVRMVSLAAKPDKPLWRIADNLTAGASTPVEAPSQTILSNNHA